LKPGNGAIAGSNAGWFAATEADMGGGDRGTCQLSLVSGQMERMSKPPRSSSAAPRVIEIVAFARVQLLDVSGPLQVFSFNVSMENTSLPDAANAAGCTGDQNRSTHVRSPM